jgi:hypothetical protein
MSQDMSATEPSDLSESDPDESLEDPESWIPLPRPRPAFVPQVSLEAVTAEHLEQLAKEEKERQEQEVGVGLIRSLSRSRVGLAMYVCVCRRKTRGLRRLRSWRRR